MPETSEGGIASFRACENISVPTSYGSFAYGNPQVAPMAVPRSPVSAPYPVFVADHCLNECTKGRPPALVLQVAKRDATLLPMNVITTTMVL